MRRWLILLTVVVAPIARSQDRSFAHPANRLALVIGNAAYSPYPLRNPVNDARAIADVLHDVGFDVTLVTDANSLDLGKAISTFSGRLYKGDIALFYYAGHGMQTDGVNYIIPVNFGERDLPYLKDRAYRAESVLESMQATEASVSIMILDACRTNPFPSSRSTGGGLAAMTNADRGSFIAFATAPGQVADDNSSGTNGMFTQFLLERFANQTSI